MILILIELKVFFNRSSYLHQMLAGLEALTAGIAGSWDPTDLTSYEGFRPVAALWNGFQLIVAKRDTKFKLSKVHKSLEGVSLLWNALQALKSSEEEDEESDEEEDEDSDESDDEEDEGSDEAEDEESGEESDQEEDERSNEESEEDEDEEAEEGEDEVREERDQEEVDEVVTGTGAAYEADKIHDKENIEPQLSRFTLLCRSMDSAAGVEALVGFTPSPLKRFLENRF